jgi:hypothetical protein
MAPYRDDSGSIIEGLRLEVANLLNENGKLKDKLADRGLQAFFRKFYHEYHEGIHIIIATLLVSSISVVLIYVCYRLEGLRPTQGDCEALVGVVEGLDCDFVSVLPQSDACICSMRGRDININWSAP